MPVREDTVTPQERWNSSIQPVERLTQLDAGPDRAQRIVLVRQGDAEHRDDRVADELLHRAAVAGEHVLGRSK